MARLKPPTPARKRRHSNGKSAPPPKRNKPTTDRKTHQKATWPATRILEESRTKYLIEWRGSDPATGAPWPPTWEPKAFANAALVNQWLESQEWPAECILDESEAAYLVRWEGDEYKDSWEPKSFVGADLVDAWEEQRRSRADGEPASAAAGKRSVLEDKDGDVPGESNSDETQEYNAGNEPRESNDMDHPQHRKAGAQVLEDQVDEQQSTVLPADNEIDEADSTGAQVSKPTASSIFATINAVLRSPSPLKGMKARLPDL
ncbi:hypothetical protein GTA08_BOTSDO12670 [Botryosphaeria dothidea]|uniref:Chromo domain-containing protein n=1 Tax=Botryosphaeria dothidea TaxID=55169 RepID=A0A8H4N492_9PEZI|nr:hypothetical protein GTA08_BOTSDO13993 [Botryosphaeria dothidea]KAF4311752.1 hypothetical protein GTA08_BOTSDO12670 [Botryosphaeria dothidea]